MYQQLTEGILFNAYIEIFIHKEDDRRIFAARKLPYSSETISTSINTRYREIKNIVFVRDVMPQKVTKLYKLNQDGIRESQLMQTIRIFRRHFQIVKFTAIKMFQFKEFDMLKKADLNILSTKIHPWIQYCICLGTTQVLEVQKVTQKGHGCLLPLLQITTADI